MSAATTQTLHHVSEFLIDRNAFDPNASDSIANFTSIVDTHEVATAYGRRYVLMDTLGQMMLSTTALAPPPMQRHPQTCGCSCI
jgi:hypothetical protein